MTIQKLREKVMQLQPHDHEDILDCLSEAVKIIQEKDAEIYLLKKQISELRSRTSRDIPLG